MSDDVVAAAEGGQCGQAPLSPGPGRARASPALHSGPRERHGRHRQPGLHIMRLQVRLLYNELKRNFNTFLSTHIHDWRLDIIQINYFHKHLIYRHLIYRSKMTRPGKLFFLARLSGPIVCFNVHCAHVISVAGV